MKPLIRLKMSQQKLCHTKNVLWKSSIESNSSADFVLLPFSSIPAQFTKISKRPNFCLVASINDSASFAFVRSAGTKMLSLPNDFTTSAPFDVFESHRTMREPLRANRWAVAFPIPDAPPVTSVTKFYAMNDNYIN